jgi:hypothetical protein
MIGTQITLNDVEQHIVNLVASKRQGICDLNNVKSKKFPGKKNDLELHIQGFGAEIACAKIFNVFFDTEISVRSTANDLGDLVYEGYRLDVKHSEYPRARLIAAIWKKADIDYYVLLTGKFPNYIYRGAMRREDLINPSRIHDLGHGPTYVAEQKDLYNIAKATESRNVG